LIIASFLFFVPPVRAAVEAVIQRLGIAFAETSQFGPNSQTGQAEPTQLAVTPPLSMSVKEVQAQISFPLLLPTWLPEGLTYIRRDVKRYQTADCRDCGRQVNITYATTPGFDYNQELLYFHANAGPGYGGPLLAETTEQTVTVNGQSGFYVHGGWQGDGQGDPKIRIGNYKWDDQADDAYLTWMQDGVTYLLQGHNLGLKLEEMLRIAESMK
jgi:hypothetical protein